MKNQKLKELCSDELRKDKINTGLLLKFYDKPDNKGKFYADFIRTEEGWKSDFDLKESRNKLRKVVDFNISDGYLDSKSILHILELLD